MVVSFEVGPEIAFLTVVLNCWVYIVLLKLTSKCTRQVSVAPSQPRLVIRTSDDDSLHPDTCPMDAMVRPETAGSTFDRDLH